MSLGYVEPRQPQVAPTPHYQKYLPDARRPSTARKNTIHFQPLSGYVMALTYAKLFAPAFDRHAVIDFLGRRIGRVYPAYITVTVVVALDRMASTPWHGAESTMALISNALMVQSWGFSYSIVGPSWSVSTEFAAYLGRVDGFSQHQSACETDDG